MALMQRPTDSMQAQWNTHAKIVLQQLTVQKPYKFLTKTNDIMLTMQLSAKVHDHFQT